VISLEALPIPDVVGDVADLLTVDRLQLALGESVDFRLLFTVAPPDAEHVLQEFKARGWPCHEIGEVRETQGVPVVYSTESGNSLPLVALSWEELLGSSQFAEPEKGKDDVTR
jgi:thiamine monophosphate kinase